MLCAVKQSWFAMSKQKPGGRIVTTISATVYVPCQSLAVYGSVDLAVIKIHPRL